MLTIRIKKNPNLGKEEKTVCSSTCINCHVFAIFSIYNIPTSYVVKCFSKLFKRKSCHVQIKTYGWPDLLPKFTMYIGDLWTESKFAPSSNSELFPQSYTVHCPLHFLTANIASVPGNSSTYLSTKKHVSQRLGTQLRAATLTSTLLQLGYTSSAPCEPLVTLLEWIRDCSVNNSKVSLLNLVSGNFCILIGWMPVKNQQAYSGRESVKVIQMKSASVPF